MSRRRVIDDDDEENVPRLNSLSIGPPGAVIYKPRRVIEDEDDDESPPPDHRSLVQASAPSPAQGHCPSRVPLPVRRHRNPFVDDEAAATDDDKEEEEDSEDDNDDEVSGSSDGSASESDCSSEHEDAAPSPEVRRMDIAATAQRLAALSLSNIPPAAIPVSVPVPIRPITIPAASTAVLPAPMSVNDRKELYNTHVRQVPARARTVECVDVRRLIVVAMFANSTPVHSHRAKHWRNNPIG